MMFVNMALAGQTFRTYQLLDYTCGICWWKHPEIVGNVQVPGPICHSSSIFVVGENTYGDWINPCSCRSVFDTCQDLS